ncbi:MAG: DUF4845 domain-containing protein [Gammaproteobacteria bacterium]|nr:DUF4845 domain-containing protein [Gammaproteobacteria bacterium]
MLKDSFKYKNQKGFTLTGWIVVIALILYFAYLAMIISPVLISNNTMNRILESLKEEPGITQKTKYDIWRLIENRMLVNQVQNITKDDFDIEKEGDVVNIYLEYDDKIKFMGNVYILIERNKSVELVRN